MTQTDIPEPNDAALTEHLAAETLALCRLPSVTGDEAAIAGYLADRCAGLRPASRVERVGNTVLAWGPRRPGRPLVALFGHSDTVKPAADQPLVYDRARGRVFGCGASDMKGGLAVMLQLLATAAEGDGADLLCVFYDKEEGPADDSGMVPLCADGAERLRGIDLAICLEPTDGDIHAGCVGSVQATVTSPGRRAHSARPWQGDNAIYAALPLLTRLRDFTRREVVVSGLPFYEVLTATQAATHNSRNVVPDRFALNLNYRFAPGKSPEQASAELRAFVRACGETYQVEILDAAPAGAVCIEEPRLRDWQRRCGLALQAKQAWTDVARLTALGLPAVNFGPGDTAEAHQANESVSAAALVRAYAALRQLLS